MWLCCKWITNGRLQNLVPNGGLGRQSLRSQFLLPHCIARWPEAWPAKPAVWNPWTNREPIFRARPKGNVAIHQHVGMTVSQCFFSRFFRNDIWWHAANAVSAWVTFEGVDVEFCRTYLESFSPWQGRAKAKVKGTHQKNVLSVEMFERMEHNNNDDRCMASTCGFLYQFSAP